MLTGFLGDFVSDYGTDDPTEPLVLPSSAAQGLGCGTYSVWLQCRGGSPNLTPLPFTALTYGRTIDDVSTAQVTVPADMGADCQSYVSAIRAWEWELSIWRNGDEVWVGPVQTPKYTPAGVTIPARDLFSWLDHRVLIRDRAWKAADLATIFASHFTDAMERDPSPRIRLNTSPTGIPGDRRVEADTLPYAGDLMRELGRTGIDWTQVGRELRAGGVEVPAAPLATLTNDWLEVTSIDVVRAPTEVLVVGGTDEDHAFAPLEVATVFDAPSGLVQEVVHEPSALDIPSTVAAARTRAEFYAGQPAYVTGTLDPKAPVTFDALVPGARLDLRIDQCARRVFAGARLLDVNVSVAVGDDGTKETVGVALGPLGTEVS